MLWDQAFEGRRSPKTILSTDNRRLSWRICLWGLLKTRHIHLFLLSKCWRPGEAHGLWTPWPHRMLGPQELLSLKSINYSMRILLKAWEVMGWEYWKCPQWGLDQQGREQHISWPPDFLEKLQRNFKWRILAFSFFFFGHKTCGISRPGIKPAILAWQGKVLTTGKSREVPGKCQGSPIHWCF